MGFLTKMTILKQKCYIVGMAKEEFYQREGPRLFPMATRERAAKEGIPTGVATELEARILVIKKRNLDEEKQRKREEEEKAKRWEKAIERLEASGVPDLFREIRDAGTLITRDDTFFDCEPAPGLNGLLGGLVRTEKRVVVPAEIVFDGIEGSWVQLNFSTKNPLTEKGEPKSFRVDLREEGLIIGEEVIPEDQIRETIVSRLAEMAS